MSERKDNLHYVDNKELTMAGFANPASLGLIGFGAALLMLCFHFADFIGFNVAVSTMVVVMGFLAQFVAGIFEMKKGNSYRATAFIVSSMYFLTMSLIRSNRYTFDFTTTTAVADYLSMGFYYAIWTVIITLLMVKMPKNHVIIYVIVTLFALFNLLLSIGEFATSLTVMKIAGYVGFATALMIIITFVIHMCNSKRKTIS